MSRGVEMITSVKATVTEVHHRISLELDTAQPITDVLGRTRLAHAVRIEYGLSPIAEHVSVVAEFRDGAELLPPITPIPPWLQQLIAEHRPDGPASRLR